MPARLLGYMLLFLIGMPLVLLFSMHFLLAADAPRELIMEMRRLCVGIGFGGFFGVSFGFTSGRDWTVERLTHGKNPRRRGKRPSYLRRIQ